MNLMWNTGKNRNGKKTPYGKSVGVDFYAVMLNGTADIVREGHYS